MNNDDLIKSLVPYSRAYNNTFKMFLSKEKMNEMSITFTVSSLIKNNSVKSRI